MIFFANSGFEINVILFGRNLNHCIRISIQQIDHDTSTKVQLHAQICHFHAKNQWRFITGPNKNYCNTIIRANLPSWPSHGGQGNDWAIISIKWGVLFKYWCKYLKNSFKPIQVKPKKSVKCLINFGTHMIHLIETSGSAKESIVE